MAFKNENMKKNILVVTLFSLIAFSCKAPGGNKEIFPENILENQKSDSLKAENTSLPQKDAKEKAITSNNDSIQVKNDSTSTSLVTDSTKSK